MCLWCCKDNFLLSREFEATNYFYQLLHLKYFRAVVKNRLYGTVLFPSARRLVVEWRDSGICSISKNHVYKIYWYNKPVETDGAGREGCSTSPRFLLNSIFDELKKIVLKWKMVQNRKTGWNSSKFIDFVIDVVTWNNNSRGKCGRFSEKYRKCGRFYKAI